MKHLLLIFCGSAFLVASILPIRAAHPKPTPHSNSQAAYHNKKAHNKAKGHKKPQARKKSQTRKKPQAYSSSQRKQTQRSQAYKPTKHKKAQRSQAQRATQRKQAQRSQAYKPSQRKKTKSTQNRQTHSRKNNRSYQSVHPPQTYSSKAHKAALQKKKQARKSTQRKKAKSTQGYQTKPQKKPRTYIPEQQKKSQPSKVHKAAPHKNSQVHKSSQRKKTKQSRLSNQSIGNPTQPIPQTQGVGKKKPRFPDAQNRKKSAKKKGAKKSSSKKQGTYNNKKKHPNDKQATSHKKKKKGVTKNKTHTQKQGAPHKNTKKNYNKKKSHKPKKRPNWGKKWDKHNTKNTYISKTWNTNNTKVVNNFQHNRVNNWKQVNKHWDYSNRRHSWGSTSHRNWRRDVRDYRSHRGREIWYDTNRYDYYDSYFNPTWWGNCHWRPRPVTYHCSPWWWWRPVGWSGISFFFGSAIASQPVVYDPGTTVVYQGDIVYLNGEAAGDATAYRQQAITLANPELEEIPVPIPANEEEGAIDPEQPEGDWLPMGVWALTQQQQGDATMFFQLSVNKEGIVAGAYRNVMTGDEQPIIGQLDFESQRLAWHVGENTDVVYETGFSSLSNDVASVFVYFGEEKTQTWLLVRLTSPEMPPGTIKLPAIEAEATGN